MQRQLDRLIEVSELETVALQILPLDGPHAIITGGFILLQFGKVHEVGYHDVACLEHLTGAKNFEEEKETYQYQLVFERLTELSLSPGRSRDVIVRPKECGNRRFRLATPAGPPCRNCYSQRSNPFAVIAAACRSSTLRFAGRHRSALPVERTLRCDNLACALPARRRQTRTFVRIYSATWKKSLDGHGWTDMVAEMRMHETQPQPCPVYIERCGDARCRSVQRQMAEKFPVRTWRVHRSRRAGHQDHRRP